MALPSAGSTLEAALPQVQYNGLNTLKASNLAGLLVDTSGNVTAPGTAEFVGVATFDAAPVFSGGRTMSIVDVTGTTTTLTAAQSGSLVLIDRTTGTTITLPTPAAGLVYSFFVPATLAGNGKVITATTASQFIAGSVVVGKNDTASKSFLGDGTSHVSIILNGTTTGGIIGTSFTLHGLSTTKWLASGLLAGSGSEATPFSTA